jgi:RNA polymerase primary sigma factor
MDALNNTSRIVRIPANKIGELSKISQASSLIEQQFEREPTIEEVAEFMGINVEDIKSANTASIRQSSLDAPFEEDEGNSLLDVISNPDADAADSLLTDRDSLRIELERLLSVLSEREREVIKQAFGLGYEYTLSLEDIADNLGLTRERVRQIKESALRKLRNNSGTRLLQPYLA